jgi:beta-phosphoglucomutase
MIAAVIFDFDGVLADTERLHLAAFADAFAARGWTLDEAAYFDRYLGFDDRGVVREFSADRRIALDEADAEALVAAKGRAFARLFQSSNVLYPDAAACVAALAGRFRLAIASGALRHEIAAILDRGALLHAFPVIVGADDVADTKPSPAPYLEAAARLGVPPAECVAVEDSSLGLDAARAAGMRTVALPTTSPRRLLATADRILDRLGELTPEIVEALDREPRP